MEAKSKALLDEDPDQTDVHDALEALKSPDLLLDSSHAQDFVESVVSLAHRDVQGATQALKDALNIQNVSDDDRFNEIASLTGHSSAQLWDEFRGQSERALGFYISQIHEKGGTPLNQSEATTILDCAAKWAHLLED